MHFVDAYASAGLAILIFAQRFSLPPICDSSVRVDYAAMLVKTYGVFVHSAVIIYCIRSRGARIATNVRASEHAANK
jgi:hypothetical protein